MSRRVFVVGQHELEYPRNVVNQRLMREAGFEIMLCHRRGSMIGRTISIVMQYLWRARRGGVAFATEGAHSHVPWIKLATLWTGHKLVFDPFISRYNTEVEDRKRFAPRSFRAWQAHIRDWLACRCADYLVFDTHEHKDYFFKRYGLDKPYRVLRVGVDEVLFRPRPAPAEVAGVRCNVLFYGTYIPLQGVDVIVQAAARLRDYPSIHFCLIGEGQELPRIRALVKQLGLDRLELTGAIPAAQLAERISAADICLGIFDPGIKAGQVVPNKVVQCAAMQKPIITRSSPSIERDFHHGQSVWLVPAGEPDALADAVVRLALDSALRHTLATGARAVFEREYSSHVQRGRMRALLDEAAALE